ncbi:MAG: hypothetical protein A2284_12695 [Deltaproteobacteria bacterium RIFOXYA12_FULL_61_11]|nr:MAG: hypothetical protein A2284_12695 [Deltaproteobacteria bacterium RIFOXYA12_FULL_61_11]
MRHPLPVRASHGFTLIELMVTILVLGLLAGLVMPRLLEMSEFYLDKAARELAGNVQYTFNRAVMKKQTYVLQFDLDAGIYRLFVCVDEPLLMTVEEKSALDSPSAFPDKAQEDDPNKLDLTVKFGDVEDELNIRGDCRLDDETDGAEFHLPETVSFKALKLQHREQLVEGGRDVAVFFPSGFMTALTVYLVDANEDGSTIEFNQLTAAFTIKDDLEDLDGGERE